MGSARLVSQNGHTSLSERRALRWTFFSQKVAQRRLNPIFDQRVAADSPSVDEQAFAHYLELSGNTNAHFFFLLFDFPYSFMGWAAARMLCVQVLSTKQIRKAA